MYCAAVVLIFSYWNVNNSRTTALISSHIVLIFSYWNVNLWRGGTCLKLDRVLIFSYWNVNRKHRVIVQHNALRINLFILECK